MERAGRSQSAVAVALVVILGVAAANPSRAAGYDPGPTAPPTQTTDGADKSVADTNSRAPAQTQLTSGDCQRYAPNSAAICSDGPLTRIEITTDLNCAANHLGDIDDEFFADTACATLLAVDGTLYGPASIPAGGSASPRTPFTPISQTEVTGSVES